MVETCLPPLTSTMAAGSAEGGFRRGVRPAAGRRTEHQATAEKRCTQPRVFVICAALSAPSGKLSGTEHPSRSFSSRVRACPGVMPVGLSAIEKSKRQFSREPTCVSVGPMYPLSFCGSTMWQDWQAYLE